MSLRFIAPVLMVVASPLSFVACVADDAAQPFRVVRHPTGRMLPGRAVTERAIALVREVQPRVVVFGAAFPLGLLAGRITRATGVPCVGWTHGVEVAVGRVPLVRGLMARVAGDLRLATAVSNWSAARVRRAVRGRCPVELLVSGVDADVYHPGVDGGEVRRRHGLGDAPVCVCVSRLVPRQGQDVLIKAWPQVVARVPDARLLLIQVTGGCAQVEVPVHVQRAGRRRTAVELRRVPRPAATAGIRVAPRHAPRR